ncbi:MAG TPA: purine-nucleoside phosphorylase [Candidatus Avipropionibacterium avicola]|uniref:Purine nucleoside phosphorylase n=1 Tax=Candidatus Avipropionibacterium avicola TaxID=2840701 RepID=A0A9D1KMU5_9ACTN|nr:purine-nucleoside phosphorylase [Candidatus Avipropionibacterium avicola]
MSTERPDPYALAEEAAVALRQRFDIPGLDHAYVLGSGWSAAADELGTSLGVAELAELPGFSAPVVAGHGGQLRVVRTATGAIAAVLTGRTHLYEGRGPAAVVHGIRAVAAAGASVVVLTNGCGGLRPEWPPGTPVLIRDHLNLTGQTPLVGPRFIDLTDAYSPRLRDLARTVAPELGEGVYAQFGGPQYETPAEVRMAQVLGADLVGMSTTVETVAAREAGMEVLAISLVTNAAAGISPHPLSHDEVVQAGRDAAPVLRGLLTGIAGAL